MPFPNYWFASALENKLVVLVGGVSTTQVTSVLNPQTDVWYSRSVIPTRTRDNSGYAMVSGASGALVLGGTMSDARSPLNASSNIVEALSVSSNSWSTKMPLPTARAYLAGGCLCAGHNLLVGGEIASKDQLGTAELLVPTGSQSRGTRLERSTPGH